MSDKKLPRLMIFGDPRKEGVDKAQDEFKNFVKGKADIVATCGIDECNTDILKGCNFAVVFGGDGTIITAARQLSQMNIPVIGVNLGKLGYLAEFNVNELIDCFDDIVAGKAFIEKRMMLNCKIFSRDKEKFNSSAINEIFITAGQPFRIIELKLSVDGQTLAGCASDGLIISTPTGSTAYNLSAGGPILSGNMEAMVITPICPHSLSFRSIVINAGSLVEVVGVRLNQGTTVSVDGQISMSFSPGDVVRVSKDKGEFLIVNNPLRTQWDTLAAKLSWAEKPKYKN